MYLKIKPSCQTSGEVTSNISEAHHLFITASHRSLKEAWSYLKHQLLMEHRSFIPYCEERPNNSKNQSWFNNDTEHILHLRKAYI